MKRIMKQCSKAITLLLCCVMVFAPFSGARAVTTGTVLIQSAALDVDLYEILTDERNSLGFFENTDGMLPGDRVDFTVSIRNISSHEVQIYMRSDDTLENVFAYRLGYCTSPEDFEKSKLEDNEKSMLAFSRRMSDDLLKQGQLEIRLSGQTKEDNIVYDGTVDGKIARTGQALDVNDITGISRYISLGNIAQNETEQLECTMSLPTTMDNWYVNSIAMVDWIFAFNYIGEPPITTPPITPIVTGEVTPEPTTVLTPEVTTPPIITPTPTAPVTTPPTTPRVTEQAPTPTSTPKPDIHIDIPDVPKTGGKSHVILYVGIACLAVGLALTGIVLQKKRQKQST